MGGGQRGADSFKETEDPTTVLLVGQRGPDLLGEGAGGGALEGLCGEGAVRRAIVGGWWVVRVWREGVVGGWRGDEEGLMRSVCWEGVF